MAVCERDGCAVTVRHWHGSKTAQVFECRSVVHRCGDFPFCVDPRTSTVEISRTLRIEVTDADVDAALVAADCDLSLVTPEDRVRMDTRAMLASFAERLRARRWVEVPASAVIPEGMLWRLEPRPGSEPNAWFRAREEIAIENVTPAHRSPEKNLYLVPADRLDDLIYPEPPKDLAERLMVRLRGAEHDLVVSELRAALAAEGVEG